MPWRETDRVDQRLSFMRAYLRGEYSFAALCRQYGVSRPVGYKWVKRFSEGGPPALFDRRRAPHRHPNQTPEAVEELIVAAREAHPTWGPRKLKAYLARRYPGLKVPAASTIGAVIRRRGLAVGRPKRRRDRPPASPLADHIAPNSCWSIDFKGQFRMGDGRYCYPLTLLDADSRYLLCCHGLPNVRGGGVRPVLEEVFRKHGLPSTIRSDNGAPFASTTFSGLTALSAWWVSLGIRIERSRPGNPQDNGRLERLHRTLKAETTKPPEHGFRSQQRRFDRFRAEYNDERPHESLDDDCPVDRYIESTRPYPEGIPEPSYPAHAQVRAVARSGNVCFQSLEFTISTVLGGQRVGWTEREDGTWDLHFYDHWLARLDLRTGKVTNGKTTKQARRRTFTGTRTGTSFINQLNLSANDNRDL